jgi:hypothetical protein
MDDLTGDVKKSAPAFIARLYFYKQHRRHHEDALRIIHIQSVWEKTAAV